MSLHVDTKELLKTIYPRTDRWDTSCELRTAIYVSSSNWAPEAWDCLPLSEQARRCRSYIDKHPEMKRVATYRNRYESGASGDWAKLLEDIINRRFDCLAYYSVSYLGPAEPSIYSYVAHVLLPGGFRVVDLTAGFDSQFDDHRKYANYIKAVTRRGKPRKRIDRKGA